MNSSQVRRRRVALGADRPPAAGRRRAAADRGGRAVLEHAPADQGAGDGGGDSVASRRTLLEYVWRHVGRRLCVTNTPAAESGYRSFVLPPPAPPKNHTHTHAHNTTHTKNTTKNTHPGFYLEVHDRLTHAARDRAGRCGQLQRHHERAPRPPHPRHLSGLPAAVKRP